MVKVNSILKVEEGFLFLLSIYLFSLLQYRWWLFPAFILLPDIGILGYLLNNKTGAIIYNFFHHKGLAILVYFIGLYFPNEIMQLAGIIIFGHASMDRLFGYGLKYPDNFKYTHLGDLKTRGNG
jgi:hypothetical protein